MKCTYTHRADMACVLALWDFRVQTWCQSLCHARIFFAVSLEILHALKVIGQDGRDMSAHHKGEGVRVGSRLTPLDLCADCMCYASPKVGCTSHTELGQSV